MTDLPAVIEKPKKKKNHGPLRGPHNRRSLSGGDLTPQLETFVLHYLRTFKGGASALEAGVPEKSANGTAWRWLQVPAVQARIERYRQRLIERTEINAERVIQELATQAFHDPRAFTERVPGKKARIRFKRPEELTEDQARLIKAMKLGPNGQITEYAFVDRQWALDRLARNLGVIQGGQGVAANMPAAGAAPLSNLPFDLRKLSDETLKLFVDAYTLAQREAERASVEVAPDQYEEVPDDDADAGTG